MKNRIKYILPFIALFQISLPAAADWFGPDNYDDCVLEEMKGQNKSMLGFVMMACRNKFPIEISISTTEIKKFSWNKGVFNYSLKILETNGNYNISKVKVIFSDKSCDEAKKTSDFKDSETFTFSKNKRTSTVYGTSLGNVTSECARIDKVWGYSK